MEKKEYLQAKVAGWKKPTRNGGEYLSLKIEVKEDVLKRMLETKNYSLNANLFTKIKNKPTQPDYATIEKEHIVEPKL